MSYTPTASAIRQSHSKAIGGGRKRCRKGKNCSATCISNGDYCLVDLPESVGSSTSKVSQFLARRPKANEGFLQNQVIKPAKQPAVKKAGGSAASASTPHKVESPDWAVKHKDRGGTALQSEIDKMKAHLDKMPKEEREKNWEQWIRKSFVDHRTVHVDGSPYTKAELDASLVRQAKAWNNMLAEGAPKELQNRIGERWAAPKGMIPDVSSSGQRKWISPEDGLKYSGGKNGVWRQNRVSKLDTERRLPAIVEFRKQQQAAGQEWPTQKLPPREGLEKDPQKLIASLTKKERDAIVFNGLDATGNEGVMLRRWYDANPSEKEARLREIVERYIAQGGRSGVSGQPVALPGLEPKAGEERTSVDHFRPISTDRKNKELTPADIRQRADNFKNFLIAEEGPNSQRGAREWGDWLNKRENEGSKSPAKPKATGPVKERVVKAAPSTTSTVAKTVPTATSKRQSSVGAKEKMDTRIQRWAQKLGISPDVVKKDEDLLGVALGGATQARKYLEL